VTAPNTKISRAKWWPLLLLLAAILSLFWPALLNPSKILYPTFSPFSDTMVIHWPKARLMAQSWQAGQGLPHWSPLILSGMPLAANQLAMLSYPPAWLFLILPLELTFNLLFVFHLLLGGVGIYLLLRENYRVLPAAAWLGGLTFALNGKWLAHAAGGHVSMVGAIGWLPWALFALLMLLDPPPTAKQHPPPLLHRPEMKWAGLAAVALAMQIVTHTLIFIYTVYLIAAVVSWHLILRGRAGGRTSILAEFKRLWLPLLLMPAGAALLGAGQLLPLLELVSFSNRSLSLAQAAEYSVTPVQLFVGLLLPSARGGHERVIYLGLIPLLLLPFGLTRRNRWSWFYAGLLLFCLLFALGPATPLHSLFYHFVPGFRWVRTPARIFFVAAPAVAILAGFAADRLASLDWSAKTQKRVTLTAVAISAMALLLGLGLAFGFGQLGRATLALAIFVPAGLGLILLRVRRLVSARWVTAGLGLLLFLDLASFGSLLMRFVSLPEAVAPGQQVAAYLAQKPGRFRVYSPSYSLPVQTAAAYNLQLADGVEPVHLAVYDRFMARAGGYNDPSFSVTIPNFGAGPLESALKDSQPDLRLLGLLNVEYLAAAFPMAWPGLSLEQKIGETYIYRNNQALPRAWVAHQTVSIQAAWLAQLQHLPNPASTVLIGPANGRPAGDTGRPPSAVRISHYSADRIELETEIPAPGWLVTSEIWYPGWQAAVNGTAQPVERVNGLLRGVYLEQPGRYQISLWYRPASVVWGNWIAGVSALLLALAGLVWLKKSVQ